jgi:hypothetical protein
VGGKLQNIINLATDTNSTGGAVIFNASNDTFQTVGSLNTPRESAIAVALPNGLTLIVGGQMCSARTYGGVSGFQCDALRTAELYNENTKTFAFAGSGSGGLMTVARSGPSVVLISGSGTALDGQVLIIGGSTGSSFLSTSAPPASAGAPTGQLGLNTAELYNPATDAFTATTNPIPVCTPAGTASCATGLPSNCPGTSSAISSATVSSGTVTVTMAAANPAGLTVGDNVVISAVTGTGFNGTFPVTSIGPGATFKYTDAGATGAGTGGNASADTAACGMVDANAVLIPNDSGKVLLAGGDLITFLGESSNLSFLFDPSTQTFSRTTGSLATPRELFAMLPMDPAVVHGALSGQVVAYGGIEANSNVCVQNTTSAFAVATTLNTAEVFNPSTQTWSAAANTMGAKRAGFATLLETGSLAGEAILPGGVDVEVGTFPSGPCLAATGIKQGATAETDLYDPGTGTGGTFTATGSLNVAREGAAQVQIGAGTDVSDVLVAGGACTTPSPSLQSVVIGTQQATTTCGAGTMTQFTNDYSELYSQSSHLWTVGPANPASPTPVAVTSASESGTTVTITMTTANPTGLVIGGSVTIASSSVAGYNGTFTVTAIPSGTTFQYTDTAGLAAGTGGTAVADDSSNAAATAALP